MAGIGPVSMSTGSLPTTHVSTMRARGVRPSASAFSAVISRTAAAPSLICDALPAVWKAGSRSSTGLRLASASSVVSRRPSSRVIVWVPFTSPLSSTRRRFDRDDLGVEATLGPRHRGAVLRLLAERVELLTR